MTPIQGTFMHGRIIPNAPLDLPDGTQVTILPPEVSARPKEEPIGLREEDWPTTQEGIAKLVEHINSFEPVELTAEEEADLTRFRSEMKRKSMEGMKRSWEKSE